MVIFVLKSSQFSMNFHDYSKNNNWKIDYSFHSAHCASLMKVGSKLKGGGGDLHILNWEKAAFYLQFRVISMNMKQLHFFVSCECTTGAIIATK